MFSHLKILDFFGHPAIVAIALLLMWNSQVVAELTATSDDIAGNSISRQKIIQCTAARKYAGFVNSFDDVEDLELDVPVHIAFDRDQKKRFLLYLNSSTPLAIKFSRNVERKHFFIFYNKTTNLSRLPKSVSDEQNEVLFPCAMRGPYDLFVLPHQRSSIKIEAYDYTKAHTFPTNHTIRVRIRTQNRIGKGQMIIKWKKSKIDHHAMNYCLVISTQGGHMNFCEAVQEYVEAYTSSSNMRSCKFRSFMDLIWLKGPERIRRIDPRITSVVCSGNRTRQQLSGLLPQRSYFVDLFGIHTSRRNLTIHIGSSLVHFNRTHPLSLRPNVLSVEKISGAHGVQVFSFKVPSSPTIRSLDFAPSTNSLHLRYLILPCGGSEVDAKILRKRQAIGIASGIYAPTYIRVPEVRVGERYIVRFSPSNEDEVLRAHKVGLAVTTRGFFSFLPELPSNITVFEVRTDCQSSIIAWHNSPDMRAVRYCIIVFNLPQRNRSAVDYTNYCLDFGKRIMRHSQFHSIDCIEKAKSPSIIQDHTVTNLSPDESYLIYVTANLNSGRPLPYQSLRVRTSHQCNNESSDSQEQASYY